MNAWAAVEAFFVISGYYMALTFGKHYIGPGGIPKFYLSRILRLFPLYFALLCVMWTLTRLAVLYHWRFAAAPSFTYFVTPQDALQSFSVWSLLLQDFLALDPVRALALPVRQAWSLSAELVFYALTPWLLKLSSHWLAIFAAASFFLKYVLLAVAGPHTAYFPFPPELGYFVVGILIYRHRSHLAFSRRWAVILVAIMAVVILVPWDTSFEKASFPSLPYGNLLLVALLGTLLPSAVRQFRSPVNHILGDISFGLYIIHVVVIEVTRTLSLSLPRPVFAVLMIGICTLISFIWEQAVQMPIDRWRRRAFYTSSGPDAAHS